MTTFRWSAISAGGEVIRGVTEAPDRITIVDRLQRQGNVVLRAELAERRGRLAELLHVDIAGIRRLDAARLSQFTRELAIMLEAGQDLDGALRFVVDSAANTRAGNIL